MKKRHIAVVVCGTLLFSSMNSIHAENFEGRESEMNSKCTTITDTKTQNECRQYKEYLENKSKNMDKEINDIKNQIASVKGDADEVRSLIQTNQKKIDTYEKEIAGIQTTIDKTNASITKLKTQIKEKTADIKLRDEQMKARIIEMQPYLGSNNYIDFLMGATSFTDLLRRTEIVGELNTYESEQIKTLNSEKKKLATDKKVVEEQKELLEVQKKNVNVSKEKVEALNAAKTTLLQGYQKQEASLANQKRTAQMAQASIPKIDLDLAASFDNDTSSDKPTSDSGNSNNSNNSNNGNSDNNNNNSNNSNQGEDDKNNGNSGNTGNSGNNGNNNSGDTEKPSETPKPNPTPTPSSFLVPLAYGTWHYESGTWNYPGGGGHMGMDFSTGSRTGIPVVAPADGIIIYSYNGGCDNNGYSGCGIPWGGGNNTLLLTKKGNTIYAMPFYHLTSATRSAGSKVSRGEVIGYSGNSGNSTGPHTHVEVINLGNISMSAALSQYNRTGDLTFGTGWNADSPKACGTAPCREQPESYWRN